jgi:hypothetical protein
MTNEYGTELDHIMTVRELIAMLQRVPNQDALIYTEGCDCEGPSDGIDYDVKNPDAVTICRNDELNEP